MSEEVFQADHPGQVRAFGKQARLTCRRDIDLVKSRGESRAGKFSIVVMLKTPPDNGFRVAFLISRRYDRLAVQRNRARRLFREAFRLLLPELVPLWLLLIPRRAMHTAKLGDVLEEMRATLRRQGCLVGEDLRSDA